MRLYLRLTLIWIVCCICCLRVQAQALDSIRFLSHNGIPTWIGIATDWQREAKVHLYDYRRYPKHALFLNECLKEKVQFKDFRNLVNTPSQRRYVPFFVFDLREKPLSVNGQHYDWAVRVEDYTYRDSPQSLANMMMKLMDLVRAQLPMMQTQGLIVIAEGGKNNYNMPALKPLLAARKYEVCTLKALLKRFE